MKIIHKSPWLTLKEIDNYTFASITKTQETVAVVPYIKDLLYLVSEIRPPWSRSTPILQSITGTIPENLTPVDAAILEVYEEINYVIDIKNMKYLGYTYESKILDTIVHLFVTDLTHAEYSNKPHIKTGLEIYTQLQTIHRSKVDTILDPLVAAIYIRNWK